jgi:cell division protein FtsA
LTEIFGLVRRRLEKGDGLTRCAAGVFLTGGTSLLPGVATLAEEVLGLPVHRPSTAPISGLTATFENPQYATPIGLIRYAQILESERPRRSPLSKLAGTVGSFFSGVKH